MLVDRLWTIPYSVSSRLRILFYRAAGMWIGDKCRIERIRIRRPSQIRMGSHNAITAGCWLWPKDEDNAGAYRIEIGNSNYFNRDVMIDSCGYVRIGSHNMFGPGVYITDSNHTTGAGRWVGDCPMDAKSVLIGNGCWIGAGAKILAGVQLGDRCIVGAGAVVTRSFDGGSVVAGVPARLLRKD